MCLWYLIVICPCSCHNQLCSQCFSVSISWWGGICLWYLIVVSPCHSQLFCQWWCHPILQSGITDNSCGTRGTKQLTMTSTYWDQVPQTNPMASEGRDTTTLTKQLTMTRKYYTQVSHTSPWHQYVETLNYWQNTWIWQIQAHTRRQRHWMYLHAHAHAIIKWNWWLILHLC